MLTPPAKRVAPSKHLYGLPLGTLSSELSLPG